MEKVQIMLAVTLKFDLLKRGAPDVTAGAVTWLLAALVHNGNLLNSYLLAADSTGWTVHAAAPTRDFFKKANWNKSIQKRFSDLKQTNLKRPRIQLLGSIPETMLPCGCILRTGLFFTTFLDLGRDALQMNPTVGERFGVRQMSDPTVNCLDRGLQSAKKSRG